MSIAVQRPEDSSLYSRTHQSLRTQPQAHQYPPHDSVKATRLKMTAMSGCVPFTSIQVFRWLIQSCCSAVTSIPTPPNFEENGRWYCGFRKGIYMYPIDEVCAFQCVNKRVVSDLDSQTEMDRMDLLNEAINRARKQQSHKHPFPPGENELRILDLGTGTGIWAIAMADQYPKAEVIGMDLANIQPQTIPPNLRFKVPRDWESPWSYGQDSFDLIHLRLGCGAVSSWPELFHNILMHLKPRTGRLEWVEVDYEPRNAGNVPFPRELALQKWYNYLKDATMRVERNMEYPHANKALLQRQGFVDIQEEIIRLPLREWPSNRPTSTHERELGRWWGTALHDGLEALSLQPFHKLFHWTPAVIRRFIEDVKADIRDRRYFIYNNL